MTVDLHETQPTQSIDNRRAPSLWAALRRIARAVRTDARPEALLPVVTKEVRELLGVAGASVILYDPLTDELFCPAADFEDTTAADRFARMRFASDLGVVGRAFKSGQVQIVSDAADCSFFHHSVDAPSAFSARNILDVPLWAAERCIGVLCAVNKEGGDFEETDAALIDTVAAMVALPIENARIAAAPSESTMDLKNPDLAKEQVIHHVSHELKTPLAVLAASFTLLRKRLDHSAGELAVIERAQRNLRRLMEMQYEIEDLLRQRDFCTTGDARVPSSFDAETGMRHPAVSSKPTAAHAAPLLPTAATGDSSVPVDERFFERLEVEFLVHELKDPLSVIESGLRMLLEKQAKFGELSPRQHRTLGRTLRSSRRARQILSGLLEVGRAEDGHFTCRYFWPEKILREAAVDCLELTVGATGPSDEAEAPAKVDAWLEANHLHLVLPGDLERRDLCQDEEKFRHIVANLIKNALHHRHRRATVTCRWEAGLIHIQVEDDGPGVSPEHRELIFQRYAQLETPAGIERRGYGLGLAGARHLARSLGGDLRVCEDTGRGACFEVTLPAEFTAEQQASPL
jgi:signal transduction histidine kinase